MRLIIAAKMQESDFTILTKEPYTKTCKIKESAFIFRKQNNCLRHVLLI